MEELLKTIIECLIPDRLPEKTGMSKEILIAIGAGSMIIAYWGLKTLGNYLLTRYKSSNEASDLSPYYNYRQLKMLREWFIPTRCQNQSATYEEEPEFSHQFVVKQHLIPFFLKIAFNEKKESDKFYLILADSGMGKTTFMVNLYLKYTSFFNFRRKYKIRFFPFGDSRILKQIKQIAPEEARDTILLLDAFDEDRELIAPTKSDGLSEEDRFRRRLDEVIEAVRDFREVVITCRTQYFPGQEAQPYELRIPRFDEKGFHKLAKLYLSPFDNREIRCYLRKKYGVLKFWNRGKRQRARAIVENSPRLMVRPMLLSYIDYLVKDPQQFEDTYQIYETLVVRWIEREAEKRKYKIRDQKKFREDLQAYSRRVALEIYRQRGTTNQLYLKKAAAVKVAHDNDIDLSNYEITGQSLLNHDAKGNWHFAHKSIWEYWIAREAIADMRFMTTVDFSGMDMAEQFYREFADREKIPEFVSIKGDTFWMGSEESEVGRHDKNESRHQVRVSDFCMGKHPVTVEQFEKFIQESAYKTDADKGGSNKKSGVNWRCDIKGDIQPDKTHPVIHVSWNDAMAYCKWLSEKLNIAVRLPREAEWEFACRAGTVTPFYTGGNLTTAQANYDGNYPYHNNPKGRYLGQTTPVGSYPPNARGLYDMHGNVWEWCMDWYGADYYDQCKKQGIVENPEGAADGSYQVLRGGSWDDGAHYCRSAYRFSNVPGYCYNCYVGFRLVFAP